MCFEKSLVSTAYVTDFFAQHFHNIILSHQTRHFLADQRHAPGSNIAYTVRSPPPNLSMQGFRGPSREACSNLI